MPSTAEFLKSVKKDQGELPFGYSNLVKRTLSLGAEIILHGSPEEYELANEHIFHHFVILRVSIRPLRML